MEKKLQEKKKEVKTNSPKAWFLATRPKTLSAAAVPVIIGMAIAWRDSSLQGMSIRWFAAMLCLFFAWVMQIDSNLVNDYYDYKHGNDNETRLGPKRACAEGWVTLPAMQRAIMITTLLGCAIGLPLIVYGGWAMIGVGILCVLFCFLYTTTLSYMGLGDLLVLLFFGIVPVCCTYYVVMPETLQGIGLDVVLASIACGLVVDTLLVVNNYRDRDNDRDSGKITLIVRIGERNAEHLYHWLGIVAVIIMIAICICQMVNNNGNKPFFLLFIVYVALHRSTYNKLVYIHEGKKLNQVLGLTARNIFIFGVTSALAIFL